MAGERYMTRDRERIREWVEERGGKPATVSSTRTDDKIVEYRDKELGGSFHSAHDITHIPGIGEATAKSILENARAD